MAATSHPSDDHQNTLNSRLGAPITLGIILLILILGYLTYRFRPKSSSSMPARSPYGARRRKEGGMEDRYHTLEGMQVFQYDSKIPLGCYATNMTRKTKNKSSSEIGLQGKGLRVVTKILGTDKRGQEMRVGTQNVSIPAKNLPSQSTSMKNPIAIVHVREQPVQLSPVHPSFPIQQPTSTSKEHKTKTPPQEESASCSICVSPFSTGENIRILPCGNGHMYHRCCIDPWLLGFAWKCPLCRTELPISSRSEDRAVRLPDRVHLAV